MYQDKKRGMTPTELSSIIAILLVVLVLIVEIAAPTSVKEGFSSLITPSSSLLSIPPRGDIGPSGEEAGFLRDPRYFHGYADVSRTGKKHDYCRLIAPTDDPDNAFFACALAGTENLASTTFRTPSVKQGLKLSRDDYMISSSSTSKGRAAYCRILRHTDGTWQPLCSRANDTTFDSRLTVDPNPPEDISVLLNFYAGALMWFRFYDDMVDYTSTAKALLSGGMMIDETPDQPNTQGLYFDGVSQFIRLTDSVDVSLGDKVPLRSLRAFQGWVYFNEFTNNAHIFDFGNGAGRDNVFLGIVGRGDADAAAGLVRSPLVCSDDSGASEVLPDGKSGAQPVTEMTPQQLMTETRANVSEFTCTDWTVLPRSLPHANVRDLSTTPGKADRATLLYEIWDSSQRKMRIRVPGVIPVRKWTHIAVTADSNDAFRPTISVYVNGKRVFTRPSGFLPSTNSVSRAYLGKSNWADSDASTIENKDELFHGRMFDIRFYKVPLSDALIDQSYLWGAEKLGLDVE
jgi:Concanavalin A-like lectin/glucanases superfamily